MEWIKTDERLPKDIKKYLVMVQRPTQMRATMEIAQRYTHKPAVNDRRLDDNFLIHGIVTHWMELPMPPRYRPLHTYGIVENDCCPCSS